MKHGEHMTGGDAENGGASSDKGDVMHRCHESSNGSLAGCFASHCTRAVVRQSATVFVLAGAAALFALMFMRNTQPRTAWITAFRCSSDNALQSDSHATAAVPIFANAIVPRTMDHLVASASSLGTNAQVHQELLARLYKHDVGLSENTMRRAVAYAGDPVRLQRVLHDLITGKPITVTTVGGSVTAGIGAKTQNLSYRERLFAWVSSTFPNDEHVFVNGGLSAATSSYMHQCIGDYVPQESDLIFVEFSLNDRQTNCDIRQDARRGFEVLLRKLLKYPKSPAVIVIHWSRQSKQFWESAEDHLDVFNKYYGVPALSWRNAVRPLIVAKAPGFLQRDLYFNRTSHPNGYNGHRYFADIIIAFLRDEAAAMVLHGYEKPSKDNGTQREAALPEPMLPGNEEGKSSCIRGQQLQEAVVSSDGWKWQNDGSEARPKWGFATWTPGSKLILKVNTATYRGKAKVVFGVGILKSYEHMGQAQLTCDSGCECDPVLLDGHWKQPSSQKKWVYASATQARECIVAITALDSTSSGEHKVFVNSFLTTDVHGSGTSWFTNVDDLKSILQEKARLENAEVAPGPSS